MSSRKAEKKCDKKCSTCPEIDCPDDYRLSCFGVRCQSCPEDCQLKALGAQKKKEITAENYAATHYIVDQSISFVDTIELMATDTSVIRDPIALARLDTARQMAFFYIEHPAEFDKLVMRFFLNKSQSDLARERKMTRANISKRIITERGDKLKREIAELKQRNAAFASMTANELKIYQICGEDGILNISNVAKQAGLSRPTVYKTLHNLSEKYGICFTLDKSKRKKS